MKSIVHFSILFIGCISFANEPNTIDLHDLRCEHLTNPIQIDASNPRLSWKLKTSNPQARNISQSAYQILVASRSELLENNEGDLWNSGRIKSDQSVLIPYQGSNLNSRQECYWKVRVWDRQGQPSAWSEIARWQMALLNTADWASSMWIGLERDTRKEEFAERVFSREKTTKPVLKKPYPSPLLRKEISIDKPIRKAMAYVSGVGYFELYINGKKISDHVLDPGQTSYDKHTLYVTHDISTTLQKGTNALGLRLGNGFYGQNIAFNSDLGYGQPRVRARFFVEYEDGSCDTFSTDTDWKAMVGPIQFDNVYGGESYDARLEMDDWCKPGFDDSTWQQAVQLDAP